MTSSALRSQPSAVLARIAPIMVCVFVAFLVIGIAMPVLPLHVHDGLGLGTFVVGLVAGSQFAASLLSRVAAGRFSDQRGAKLAVMLGLLGAAASGVLYAASLWSADAAVSAAVLIAGRALLGASESFIITGALGWGLALVPPGATGRVIAWVGSAMYAAFAIGAPIGAALYASYGFEAVALATIAVPLLTFGIAAPLQPVPPLSRVQPSTRKVLADVWLPGLGLALSSVGLGAITAFVVLLFSTKGWGTGWQAFTAFAVAFIAARTFFGQLPDRQGGARVALVSVLVEAAGLALVWAASSPAMAVAGAALTGLGYSLVYPGLGIEAVRRAPPESRALAMGAFTACLDLALGIANPALGLVAARWGIASIFLVSACVVAAAAAVAYSLAQPARI